MTVAVKNERTLQQDVLAELAWDPEVQATEIGVVVTDGIVTLTGTVDSYAKRGAAERAALRIAGVRAVANEIIVKTRATRTDSEIARTVADALAADELIPHEQIRVTVADGWVTLEGTVDWAFQRREVEAAIRPLAGVTGLTNRLTIRQPAIPAPLVQEQIKRTLRRNAHIDAEQITVDVANGCVTLIGTVPSWAERQAAEDASWRTPGVTDVANKIRVEPTLPRT